MLHPSKWKPSLIAAALISGAILPSAAEATSSRNIPAISASAGDIRAVAGRRRSHTASSSRSHTSSQSRRAKFYPYGRRWRRPLFEHDTPAVGTKGYSPYPWYINKPGQPGYGPAPTGQYPSFEMLDHFPGSRN
jgi:hypothetical protein